ncbi:hypothetical protein NIES2109_51450 [Nostoc sp. HK-01]|uniref:Uncharacterized protein n=2 Tax=Nostocales TaxID=1161 RepID=A0A2H6LR52_9NOSO|nr:hypothetical protein [Nostoc cycadae]BAY19044.1 hypothetical protein NIES21_49030 [Anabaenopsis circularis NIES-21]BBD62306.1 hypothetical protein NIES2109_51450 [Nostoc sp. HK-01]GBE92842.1 hypothetical protein NCWK1_2601 [Nostoc cycadae WK-1]GBE95678.1 hypothetical protein NCWK1_5466 [Nostoc cycadae WK-1]
MKVKLLNVLTVCLVTLIVISPAMVALKVVWEKHGELVKAQNLTCEVNNINKVNQALEPVVTAGVNNCDRQIVNQPPTTDFVYKLAIILQWFILLTPVCIGLGILVYDRYLVHRAAVFQEQVEMLERLWQQSIEQ